MIKIAIVGPESTGKTDLAEQLAIHYKAAWMPEYAREYVEQLQRPYTFDDVCNIAGKQIEQEQEIMNRNSSLIFFDTDLVITKVWFEFCYNTVPEFVTERLNERFMDMYLLCVPDLPWQPDPVREHGDDRDYFFDRYEREIKELNTPCSFVKGIGNKRIKNAIQQVDIFLKQKNESY